MLHDQSSLLQNRPPDSPTGRCQASRAWHGDSGDANSFWVEFMTVRAQALSTAMVAHIERGRARATQLAPLAPALW